MTSETLRERQQRKKDRKLVKWGVFGAGALFILGVYVFVMAEIAKNAPAEDFTSSQLQRSLDDQTLDRMDTELQALNADIVALQDQVAALASLPAPEPELSKSEVRGMIRYMFQCHEGKFRHNEQAQKQDPNCIPYHVGK